MYMTQIKVEICKFDETQELPPYFTGEDNHKLLSQGQSRASRTKEWAIIPIKSRAGLLF